MNNLEELNEEELEKISGGKKKLDVSKPGKSIYKCDFCGEEFDKRKDLDKHVKSLHANVH